MDADEMHKQVAACGIGLTGGYKRSCERKTSNTNRWMPIIIRYHPNYQHPISCNEFVQVDVLPPNRTALFSSRLYEQ